MREFGISIEEILIRIIFAILIGGIIGYERGRANRPAGFCTHILVCLGACIIALIQDNIIVYLANYIFSHPKESSVFGSNLGRMGEKVVSGIGFLGAGTILSEKGIVKGLTTAASIWITGCIGFTVGWGYCKLGIIFCIFTIFVLSILSKVERKLIENTVLTEVMIEFHENKEYKDNLFKTHKTFKGMKVKIEKIKKDEINEKVFYTLNIPKQIYGLDFSASVLKEEYIKNIEIL